MIISPALSAASLAIFWHFFRRCLCTLDVSWMQPTPIFSLHWFLLDRPVHSTLAVAATVERGLDRSDVLLDSKGRRRTKSSGLIIEFYLGERDQATFGLRIVRIEGAEGF